MGGYAYAADNPVTDSDPTGQIAVGPPGSGCSTGTEYNPQCSGNGTGDAPAPGGGGNDGSSGTATSTATSTSPSSSIYGCNKFDCASAAAAWAHVAPTPGGWKSLLAGVGGFFVGFGDMAVCSQPLACLGYKAIGGEMPSALYTNWLNSHGVDTSANSTYTDGIALMGILTLAIGGAADAPGVTADAAEDGGDSVNLASATRTEHILNGDATGGGHMWPGAPGKSVFPETWSGSKIMNAISDIATDPNLEWEQITGKDGAEFTKNGAPVRFSVAGIRDGIPIKVILEPGGEGIISGYPVGP
jgi:hypothetical protein